MSPAPTATALDPSMRTSPAVMYALIRVRRGKVPLPYVPVRHSVLARLPGARLGQRFALPAAIAGRAASPKMTKAAQIPASAAGAETSLRKDRTHEKALGVGEDPRVPHAGTGDEGQLGERARGEQGRIGRAHV